MTPNPAYLQALQDSVRTAPYPHLIGMTLAAIDFDSCRIELELGERHLQPFGIVHGGVLATLIDTGTFWAGFLRLPDDARLVNVDLKLNYLKAVARPSTHRRPLPARRPSDQLRRSQRVR